VDGSDARGDHAFVYGTLRRGFPLHRLLAGRAEFVGLGTVPARLVDLGAYPAAVPDAHGLVVGEVYRLTDAGLLERAGLGGGTPVSSRQGHGPDGR